jgi:DNA-binding MarR family transcriptional regulator
MSTAQPTLGFKPLVALVDRAARLLQADMVRQGRERGQPIRMAHNAVFANLPLEGARTSDMAARAGITKQSMGESVRELVDLGIVEMTTDPEDRRAKLVTWTESGRLYALEGRRYIAELEGAFEELFGKDEYQSARRVLESVITWFDDRDGPGPHEKLG